MSIREGRPFSVSYKALRGDAGGMDMGKAFTEGPDDSFDEFAGSHHAALLRHKGVQYLIEANKAPGLLNMPHLYGLGEEAPVKIGEGLSGVFNQGFTAKVAHMDPVSAYHESATDSVIATLNFRTADFVNAYEASPEDIAKVKVNTYMTQGTDRGIIVNRLLGELVTMIQDPEENGFWKAIYTMESRNYMLHIFTLRPTHPMRADLLRNFFPCLRKTYFEALKAGKEIVVYLDDPATDIQLTEGAPTLPKLLRADRTNFIDPLGDRAKFPALQWRAVLRQHTEFGLMAELSLWNEGAAPETAVKLWIHAAIKADGSLNLRRVKTPEIVDTEPAFWAAAGPYVTLTSGMNIIDDATAEKQRKELNYLAAGSEIQSREDLRGIMTLWAYRLIGGAYWPNKTAKEDLGYGDQRNAHEPRCVVSVRGDGPDARLRKMNAVEALRIQSNKHNNRMDEAHLIIRFVFAATFGTLVRCYSEYANGRNKDGRTEAWDIPEFVQLMKSTWLPKVAAKKPAGATGKAKKPAAAGGAGGAGGGSSANSIVNSGSEEEDDGASRSSDASAAAAGGGGGAKPSVASAAAGGAAAKPSVASAAAGGAAAKPSVASAAAGGAAAKPSAPIAPLPPPRVETSVSIPNNNTDEKLVKVLKDNKEVAKIPYVGQFHVTRNFLLEVHSKLGDDRFVEYAKNMAAMNTLFFS